MAMYLVHYKLESKRVKASTPGEAARKYLNKYVAVKDCEKHRVTVRRKGSIYVFDLWVRIKYVIL